MAHEIFKSVASFLASLDIWTLFLGGNFMPALVLMVVLLIHEMGHYIAARCMGARAELPVFMVLGAFVRFENDRRTLRDDFIVSAAGPVFGTVAAGLMYMFAGHNIWLMQAAALGFVLNLFQLIPVPPFDGGHMTLAIDRRIWKVGAIIIIGYAGASLFYGNFMPALLVFLMWDGSRNYMQAIEQHAQMNPELYEVPGGEKLAYTIVYFGLTAALIFISWSIGALSLL